MLRDDSSPSYEVLFGELDLRGDEDARSVYSPAAYFVDLLALLEGSFDRPSLLQRRPDLKQVLLDAGNTFAETPYLDIVNQVLERLTGPAPYDILRNRVHSFGLPFSLGAEQLKKYLHYLQVTPLELYRLFAPQIDQDIAAREYLELSAEDVGVVTTAAKDETELAARYGVVAPESLGDLRDALRFAEATGLTGAQVQELIPLHPPVTLSADGTTLQWVGSTPLDWLDRIHRFVRLARLTGLSLTDLSLALNSYCGGRIDAAALRVLTVVLRLKREHDLSVTEICRLVVPIEADEVQGCSGDILAARNNDYRFRLAAWIEVAESDIVTIVRRYREHYAANEPSPFDQGDIGLREIGLLHRAGRLAAALGVSPDELFDVLVALDSDPSLHRYTNFDVLGDPPQRRDCFAILTGDDPAESLWLAQTLFAVVTWTQAAGFSGRELTEVLGGRPETADPTLTMLTDGIRTAFEEVAFDPAVFARDRFGPRAAKVVHDVLTAYDHGVVSPADDRLLRLDLDQAAGAAYDGVTDLGVVVAEDFLGLGLGERLQAKIISNLVVLGVLNADGTLAVDATEGLPLQSEFGPYREMLFKMIGAVINGAAAFFPSDLDQLGLDPARVAELYDNLRYNGYLDENGDLTDPEFFIVPSNEFSFEVNADLWDAVEAVRRGLGERLTGFADYPLPLDPEIFAELRLTEAELAALIESLAFNGYLDENGNYRDKAALIDLSVKDLGLALEFYPRRQAILDAIQKQLLGCQTDWYTFTVEDFADIADEVMSRRVVTALDGPYTSAGRVLDEALFADPAGFLDLGPAFTITEQDAIFSQIRLVLDDEKPYRLAPGALTQLGFDDEQRDRVRDHLVESGFLTKGLAVTQDWLPYFRNVNNAYGFTLPGLADFATDVFFLLHDVAGELAAAVTEIVDALVERAKQQTQAFGSALADAFGLPAATAVAIAEAVTGGPEAALDTLVAPVLASDEPPAEPRFRLAYRRIRRFALLAGKLGLDPTEVAAVFTDQDLVGKFPENLTLPPGIRRFDALLEGHDGKIYLFAGNGFWTYSADTLTLGKPTAAPLTDLSARFHDMTVIDAAFTMPSGLEWLVGHTSDGTSKAFTRQPGGTRWAPQDQVWGKVRNNFTDPARIDGAFADRDGRTYLFSGDQYIRYSGTGYSAVDEGYPRPVSEWREREGLGAVLPGPLDAFQAPDGTIHVLTGANGWGRVRNAFENVERIDAAYSGAAAVHLFAGGQVVRYSDSVENAGVYVDEGYPRAIHDVPGQFESGVDAAFTDPNGVLHVFKDGRTASGGTDAELVATARRWGLLPSALPTGRVDAALAGPDGRTYLFSGGTYLRYSDADYTVVDPGYPRAIDTDWAGLSTVDAAFVMDDATYLFGTGGLLFDLTDELRDDLAAGQLTPRLRNRFSEHGLTLTGVSGAAPVWTLTTGEKMTLTVKLEGRRTKVFGDGSRCYVRYGTNDFRTPDAGFPKPQSDNWWNMPDGLNLGPVDAVFTGLDDNTYLFAGKRFVRFDARHRWWSEPMSLRARWDSVPFDSVDAAFVGQDGRTYLFHRDEFVRYSTADYTEVDDGYPAKIASHWANVRNNIERTSRVDAALVTEVTEKVDGADVARTYTYLFSGDQYVRYLDADYAQVQLGYPRLLESLNTEPGLTALESTVDRVDAAFADRRTSYLFSGKECNVVSATPYRRYDDLNLGSVSCAFIENGSIMTAGAYYEDWTKRSAFEGRGGSTATPFRPRTLRTVPPDYRTGLDSVLIGADGNSYLFKGAQCFNTQLNRAYPLAEEWGRPRNTIYEQGRVDAAFVGRDGKTYLFSDDQFVVYPDAGTEIDGDPRPIAEHWAGLTSVALAYVHGDQTFLYEQPDAEGMLRCLVYSGTDYGTPDAGFPIVVDDGILGAPDGFPFPDAVLVEGDTLILLSGEDCVSYNRKTKNWSVRRPIERLFPGFGQGLDAPDGLRTAFTATDGTTYFFFDDTFARFAGGAYGPLAPTRDRWGLSRNPFVTGDGTVDAAFVWRQYTFLFSGDHYVRYTGPGYRAIDPGYPRKTAGNLRLEAPFTNLPDTFDDALDAPINAVIGNERTIHLIVGGVCHTVSPAVSGTYSLEGIGRARNTIEESGTADAAMVAGHRTFLFSGDQYVRYSGAGYTYVDDGYPRPLAQLADEQFDGPGIPPLPKEFTDGVDAAFRSPDGRTYLFRGKEFVRGAGAEPVNATFGKVRNEFGAGGLDAAFVAATGELFAFRGEQYVRYSGGGPLEFTDPGFPRTVRDDFGDLPWEFESGVDGAFAFEGRTYLTKEEQYVRYSTGYDTVDRTFPQEFQHRWSGTADYRLSDLHTIVRFTNLSHSHPDGLAALFTKGADDPYELLGSMFGWDVEELRWARRNSGLLTEDTPEEKVFEIEFLLRLVDLFGTARKFGAGPSRLHADVWSKLYPGSDPDAAVAALYGMLERRTGPAEWPKLDPRIHDELNALKRDALVAAITPAHGSSRDLFERYLIDVDMGPAGTTSRVREAIAATQLFLHRYLLDLEHVELPAGADPDEVKARIRTWWSWLRNYRIWEANRKVFLYPENYIRPELRTTKTPVFAALQDDLLQNEITAETVQTAYKRYLDEYTEVSRLAIAGGYVYTEDGAAAGVRKLVLFGRTRTEPHRYYVRSATFRDGEKLSSSWEPWRKVDVQIAAERVDPVHAFGRVFVFWPVVEPVTLDDASKTTITTTPKDGGQAVSAPPPRYQVKIYYSFQNLNGEWVPAQLLAADREQTGPITVQGLYVQASRKVPGVSDRDHDSIVAQCTYTVGTARFTSAFTLTPELYSLPAKGILPPPPEADLTAIFAEPATSPVNRATVVQFNAPADSVDLPWSSVDHKGGSFLCRPVAAPVAPAELLSLSDNNDFLPTSWTPIEAAFQIGDTRYFFDNSVGKYVTAPKDQPASVPGRTKTSTADTFGAVHTNLLETGVVDAAMVHENGLYLLSGDEYYRYQQLGVLDDGYPKKWASRPPDLPAPPLGPLPGPGRKGASGPFVQFSDAVITFDNDKGTYTIKAPKVDDSPRPTRDLGRVRTKIRMTGRVDAAYVTDKALFLVSDNEFVRFTLGKNQAIPNWADRGYPKTLGQPVDAVFTRDGRRYVFSGENYGTLADGQELDATLTLRPIMDHWRCLPAGFPQDFDGVLQTETALYFFMGTRYAVYPMADAVPLPYEVSALPHQIIRLTSSTAYELNRRLLVGGIDELLAPDTQELDEQPAFSAGTSDATTIQVLERTMKAGVPVGSHLDFDSSNGLYYWEIFFHAPMLIAEALAAAQRFEDAKRWYEYVFDPTQRERYWRFLPFLAVDIDALVAGCRADLLALADTGVTGLLGPILDTIEPMAPAFLPARELTAAEADYLAGLATGKTPAGANLGTARTSLKSLPESEARRSMLERVEMIALLDRQYKLMGDRASLMAAYRDDPFDPHRIAALRPAAYRRTVVMAYIDNLLDWGDLLFRQYTGESIDEARMLYIFAYDLLGQRPYDLGPRALPPAATYDQLDGEGGSEVAHLTADGALLEGSGAVHGGVANPYFYVPNNSMFLEYWTRVEDRLTKIRASMDIMGISRPVPLFEPPADVMALVEGVAKGASLDQITAALAAPVPAYRFAVVHRRAQELTDRLKQLGADLLSVYERRDGEELALMQNRQEAAIQAMTRAIKENQIEIARAGLREMQASLAGARGRVQHYQQLIAAGLSPLQQAQLAMMSIGAAGHFVSGGLKIGAAVSAALPEVYAGPFIMGVSEGGQEIGESLNIASEVSASFAEGFSMLGEVLGVRADQERQEEDWRVQLATAQTDVEQIGHQVRSAELQVAVAQRELEILDREAKNVGEVGAFLTSKFAGAQLYGWMVGRLSGLYFQTYNLAYELARTAERAYQFERGTNGTTLIQPTYWESRRNGLLAAECLALDLDRLGQAYVTGDRRGLEITRRVSLLQLDPVALLTFRDSGRCEFALTEELFDRDFPGHYDRQIRTVGVSFDAADGPVGMNATLTQLDNKTVLSPDPKAVKYLLDPKGTPPDSLRGDWRPSQQIALSDLEEGRDNNGLFELRYDDERYLPFEGTGAVSRWLLSAGRVTADLVDVTITVKYTADQGGDTFATAVKGMLRPYPSARYFEVASEFPEEWAEFAESDSTRLTLPVTPELLPGITGRQITGMYARYQLAGDGEARFLLNGDQRLALDDGKLLRTPGLTTGGWTLAFEGDKSILVNMGLILTYRAGAQ